MLSQFLSSVLSSPAFLPAQVEDVHVSLLYDGIVRLGLLGVSGAERDRRLAP
jgi:hypothetical protein